MIKTYALLLLPALGLLLAKGLSTDSLFLFMLWQTMALYGMLASKLQGNAARLFWVLCLFNGLLVLSKGGQMIDGVFAGVLIGLVLSMVFFLVFSILSAAWHIVGESDLKPGVLYLVLKKPRDPVDQLLSLAGVDCSSISYCYGDLWVRFRADHGCIVRCDINRRHGYTFIELPHKASSEQLQSLIGTKWSMRCNCVNVWAKIWYDTALAARPLELFPSQYAARIIRGLG